MSRRDGTPQWVQDGAPAVVPLRRADLRTGAGAPYDEAWLQRLLFERPDVFPIDQIDDGFGDLIPLCRELPLTLGGGRSGALDNLFVTASGGLVLVEAKLWRNPEARRSVVAQAMEYAAAVFRMSYEDLEYAVAKARKAASAPGGSIFEIVSSVAQPGDQAHFTDKVAKNLRIARAIVAVVGDGIREDIAPLAELLQSHAGHRFNFALVELAVYETPVEGTRIIVPSVLAKTALIERGVIKFERDPGEMGVSVHTHEASPGAPSGARRLSVSEDEFRDALAQSGLHLPALLDSFLAKAKLMGVEPEMKGGMNLKSPFSGANPLNLGTVRKDGYVDTAPATWWDRTPGRAYNEALAALIGGTVNEMKSGRESVVRTKQGKTPRLSDFLPEHEEAWLNAMQRYISDMAKVAEANGG